MFDQEKTNGGTSRTARRSTARIALVAICCTAFAACADPAPTQEEIVTGPDSAAFVTRLGNDTLVVERFVRSADRMEADVILRSPRTVRTTYLVEFTPEGAISRMESESTRPGDDAFGTRRQVIERMGDSLQVTATTSEGEQVRMAAAPDATLPFIDMVHWPFEVALMRAHMAEGESAVQPLLTGSRTSEFPVAKVGYDSMTITHPSRGTMRVHIDDYGRLVALDAGATTRKLLVERKQWEQPMDELASQWAALDASGQGVGDLSGRGAADVMVKGANIVLDYGTPVKRGRDIWGALVPYGELWRTGANRATHFSTSRVLTLGTGADTLHLPAGEYTLFSVPEADGGELIVNSQTGQNGNSYNADNDFGRVRMQARDLPEVVEVFTIRADEEGDGGVLRLQWDRKELVVPFTVR